MPPLQARQVLSSVGVVNVAGTAQDGTVVLKTVNGVVVNGHLCFHGAPAGEKMSLVGRQVVVAAHEVVAQLPSYFVDPELACPATTLYRSVQVRGVLEAVEDAGAKARALQALMERYQPEGGHVPIGHDHPAYRKVVAGLLVVRVSLERFSGKAKLGQNRKPHEVTRIVECLWQRGRSGDLRAMELMRVANPLAPLPGLLQAPPGFWLHVHLEEADVDAAVALVRSGYWNAGISNAALATAHRNSSAWVGCRNQDGALVGTARAVSDGAKHAAVYDVMVAPEVRGQGLGRAMVRLLLDHPAVRSAHKVVLRTRDAHALYRPMGFVNATGLPPSPYDEMVLIRSEGNRP